MQEVNFCIERQCRPLMVCVSRGYALATLIFALPLFVIWIFQSLEIIHCSCPFCFGVSLFPVIGKSRGMADDTNPTQNSVPDARDLKIAELTPQNAFAITFNLRGELLRVEG